MLYLSASHTMEVNICCYLICLHMEDIPSIIPNLSLGNTNYSWFSSFEGIRREVVWEFALVSTVHLTKSSSDNELFCVKIYLYTYIYKKNYM